MKMLRLPMGCYFTPKPHECIQYLSLKVHGSLCSFWAGLIFDCDPYSAKQLPNLFSTVERRDNLYLFTKLRRKGKIGSVNIDRTIIDGVGQNKGSWHGEQIKDVCDADDISVIGSARTFTFRGKEGDPNNRRFLMTEYQLLPPNVNGNGDGHDSAALHYDPLKDHVLCHIRCNAEGKQKKAIKSINNLMMSFIGSPPFQSLPPQPPCPAADYDITEEACPPCSTTPTPESASPPYSLQTPVDFPFDNVLADTDLIAMERDDDSYEQLELSMGATVDDEDVLPLSSADPLHVYNDDQLSVISVAAADNSSSYRHDVEPLPVRPLANAEATPSPGLLDNPTAAVGDDYYILFDMANEEATPSPACLDSPTAAVEDDYDILFDNLSPINSQSQWNGLNWNDLSEFLDQS